MKYIVEGNIYFFQELYNSLYKEENYIVTECCLITNEPLVDKYVKLECGHCFNYVPLYYDIYNHKKKFNRMEDGGHLSSNEIRCPYCRHKQKGVLPYYEELGLEKVPGVNMFTEIHKASHYYNTCEFLTENPKFNPELPEAEINYGNCKFYKCYFNGTKIINEENYGDEKYYCWSHKKIMIKKYKLMKKEKEKEAKLKLKEEAKKVKDDAKKIKEEAKFKLKEDAKKEKINKLKNMTNIDKINLEIDDENHVLPDFVGCVEILKSRIYKGASCNQKVFQDNMCKRHFNLHNKNVQEIQNNTNTK